METVATRCHILKRKCTRLDFGWSSAPDPAERAYRASPDPELDLRGPLLRKGGKEGWEERAREGER